MVLLTQQEIDGFLLANPKWIFKDDEFIREWSFEDFIQAIAFVNRIAAIAEAANHHPNIDIRYNHVRLSLTSHDAGGVTSRDLRMVETLNQEVE